MSNATATKKHIDELHSEHRTWKNRLEFADEEIKFFNKRLEEIISKNTSNDIRAKTEQFQNQFLRQKEVLDTYYHDIKLHEEKLSQNASNNPVAADHKLFHDHGDLREKMEDFDRLFKELKQKYFRFLAETL